MKKIKKTTIVSAASIACGIVSLLFPVLSSWTETESEKLEKEELNKQLDERDRRIKQELLNETDARYRTK